jgi:hypothetical protein
MNSAGEESMKCNQLLIICAVNLFAGFLLFEPAMAYIGPGAGLSAIGAFLAVIAAIIAALFGFVWYPIKQFVRKLRNSKNKKKGDLAE